MVVGRRLGDRCRVTALEVPHRLVPLMDEVGSLVMERFGPLRRDDLVAAPLGPADETGQGVDGQEPEEADHRRASGRRRGVGSGWGSARLVHGGGLHGGGLRRAGCGKTER